MRKTCFVFGLTMLVLAVCSVAFADPALAQPLRLSALFGSGMALIVNGSTLTGIFTNIKTTFNKVFDATPGYSLLKWHFPLLGRASPASKLSK